MKITFHHNDYYIEVFDDSAYSQKPDSPTQYDKVYEPEIDKEFKPSSQHAVTIYDGEKQVSNAIILAAAGATSVTEDSTFIHDCNLILRCSNVVVSLTIPKLDLNWMTAADPVTCFSIHKYRNDYITHGEISVCKIDQNGTILWQFGSADIFLRLDGESCFAMNDNSIYLKNFEGTSYEINYDGKLLNTLNSTNDKKPWWKFW